ncbi:MAG: hypothetical protein ABIO49_16260 [Dokdonella sp.]
MAGFVLDETAANFSAANPASSGVLSTLNLANLTSADCAASCTFTRTLTSTTLVAHSYQVTFNDLPVGAAIATPDSFTIAAGGTQVITISIDGTVLSSGWNFGQLEISTDDILLPLTHMPIAINL